MLYAQHRARPPLEYFEKHRGQIPNFSMRLSNLAAAAARPQIALLEERAQVWNERYRRLALGLGSLQNVRVPPRPHKEQHVMSSIQFSVKGLDAPEMEAFLAACGARGVFIKWFGRADAVGFTSVHDHWEYVLEKQSLPRTRQILSEVCDMRIPLALPLESCDTIVSVIRHCLSEAQPSRL